MKRIFRILVLAVALFSGLMTASAQTVQVLMIQKVPTLPITVTSYLDDPLRYFNVQFILTGADREGLYIYFDMEFTVNTNPLWIRTDPNIAPILPIHLHEGVNLLKSDVLSTQLINRTQTDIDYSDPVGAQQLPEGTYQVCVTVYRWSDVDNPAREPINIGPCPTFDICYSGSAPELVSPMTGAQMALNGANVVSPNRKVNFFWTPVISNCADRGNRFKYKLKVVKVLDGQNYNDAIKYNPTVFSTEVRNNNVAVFDTLRDIKVNLEKGALYVAQVQAERIATRGYDDPFIIANEGNSQPMPFFWGGDPADYADVVLDMPNNPSRLRFHHYAEDEFEEGIESEGVEGVTIWAGGVEESSQLETIIEGLKAPYLAGFIRDDATVASLTATYPDEWKYVPALKRRYVASDGYYTVPMTDDLEVSFMPTRHESLKDASYSIKLYDYVDGGLDSIVAYEPLFTEEIEKLPESYNKMDNHDPISRTLAGWGSELVEGNVYYLQLTSLFTVGYWKYSVADTSYYVNQLLAEHVHDTISREFTEDELMYSNGIFFQWGDDPAVPGLTTPQWQTPVNRIDDDIYDPSNFAVPTSIPEVQKAKSFTVSWAPFKDVSDDDVVEYEVKVYELKEGQTLEEALSANTVLATRTVTGANTISKEDKDFFKVFSPNKTYVMTLSTTVNSESNGYHFENGNQALPITFKVVK